MSKEKPIIFSTLMVKAILEGRKTQTRRVMNPQPWSGQSVVAHKQAKQKYHVGDILWVRETWGYDSAINEIKYCYKADGGYYPGGEHYTGGHWHPSIHMPRKAARIFLEVTNVRVERLQDISIEDCIKEGVILKSQVDDMGFYKDGYHAGTHYKTWDEVLLGEKEKAPKHFFKGLWNTLNAKRGYSWENNPWVWVIELKRVKK